MKRLSPLPARELVARGNLWEAACNGFWWCKRCNRVVEIERRLDGQDESRSYAVCAVCGTNQVREHQKIF